ncbi:MAG TPA: hypothetical protein QGF58_23215 [Myxococcota bacterium]|nr:hypothetical protein [Myxococcota bacterium]
MLLVETGERALDQLGLPPGDIRRFHMKRRRLVCVTNAWEFDKVLGQAESLLMEARRHGWPTFDVQAILATNLAIQGEHAAAKAYILEALDQETDPGQRAQLLSIRTTQRPSGSAGKRARPRCSSR